MQQLNRQFRGKDKTTDVLSFSLVEGEGVVGGLNPLGDIVISVPTAERQAESLGEDLQKELLRLLIHGFLHLIGYEHEQVPTLEAERMREKENELFHYLLTA